MKRNLMSSIVAGAMSLLALSSVLPAFAQSYNGQTLQGRVTYVPVGTNLDCTLSSPIDSGVAKPGRIGAHLWYWLTEPQDGPALDRWAKAINASVGHKAIDPATLRARMEQVGLDHLVVGDPAGICYLTGFEARKIVHSERV